MTCERQVVKFTRRIKQSHSNKVCLRKIPSTQLRHVDIYGLLVFSLEQIYIKNTFYLYWVQYKIEFEMNAHFVHSQYSSLVCQLIST